MIEQGISNVYDFNKFSLFFLQISNDSDIVLFDDGTGVSKVIGCCKIPYMSDKLMRGE